MFVCDIYTCVYVYACVWFANYFDLNDIIHDRVRYPLFLKVVFKSSI